MIGMKWLAGMLDAVEESLHVFDPIIAAWDAWSRLRFQQRLVIVVWGLAAWALFASDAWLLGAGLLLLPALFYIGRFLEMRERVNRYRLDQQYDALPGREEPSRKVASQAESHVER